ncbi:MFS transporter [Catellatospora citrea]|uniref:MFS transporter n=1 Tax=Catellatospora citrea TaxID=53366 RepID=A0A8J3KM19_9ACTN|nr:MFS transporter [Catellatospora citrea]RKE09235.1 putative MFS family arabinose efflux permease [Catellatospora citrea]GIF99585.1 MFS transporter [Catellatospora citrea]
MRARLSTTFRSLTVRNYRLFAGGQLIKLIGVWMMYVAQDWLVLELSNDSPTALGLVTALQFVPVMLLTLYAGTLADRFDKRTLLMVSNGVWAVLAIAQAILIATGVIELWHIMIFAGLLGVAQAIETPVRQAFVSELVGKPLLPNALSLSAATFQTARITGPALAGVAIAWLGTGPVFLVSTVMAIAPVLMQARMIPTELHRPELLPRDERAEAKVVDGLRYVRTRHDLLLPMAMMFVIAMFGYNFQLTLALLAKTVFATGAATFGLFNTALAVGSLAGALAGTARKGRPSVYLLLAAAVAFGLLAIAVGFAPYKWLVLLLLVPTGFSTVFLGQAANQRVQLGVDGAFRGRVMALYVLIFLGTAPIGSMVISWIAEHFGAAAGIWLGGAVSLLAALAALVWQLRHAGDRLAFQARPTPRVRVVHQESVAVA